MRAYAQRLGLVEVINRLVPSDMEIDPGTIVLGMVIDTLSGRSPLYHLEAFFEQQDRALLLGRELEARVFNDDNVGRVAEQDIDLTKSIITIIHFLISLDFA